MSEFTREDLSAILVTMAADSSDWLASTVERVNQWLTRGDGVAVYVNEDLGSAGLGDRQIVSFGSSAAQIETTEPPITLPNIGGATNWQYQLEYTYRGDPLVIAIDNPRDLRQTAKRADIRDVIDLRWSAALDNYQPVPRRWASGYAQWYSTDDVTHAVVLWDTEQLRDASDSVYLIDDGDTVRPYYVSGHPANGESLWLNPFPTTVHGCSECLIEFTEREEGCDSCYSRKQRNGFRPITFETWSLGPRRAYHLKVKRYV